MARNTENKRIGYLVEDVNPHNAAITGADCYPLVAQIQPAGSAGGSNSSQQRIGDRIKPVSLVVKGRVSFNQNYLPSQQPIIVRVMILQQKDIKVGVNMAPSFAAASLLHPGQLGADEIAFSGNLDEIDYPINKNKFRVYMDKKIQLCSGDLAAGTSREQLTQWARGWSFTFKKKQLPASLTFDTTAGNWPNNFAPFVCLGWSYADGTSPGNVGVIPIVHTVSSYLDFEDA